LAGQTAEVPVDVWMHATRRFKKAVDTLKTELRSDADPILGALVETYTRLRNDPWIFARKKAPDAKRGSFSHIFYPGYELTYRIEADFQGEATLIRQHVYLKNILRPK
jgi:hypothetical protein